MKPFYPFLVFFLSIVFVHTAAADIYETFAKRVYSPGL